MKNFFATFALLCVFSLTAFADGAIDMPGKNPPPPGAPAAIVVTDTPAAKAINPTDNLHIFWTFTRIYFGF